MSYRLLRRVKVPNNAFASGFVLKSEQPQRKRINYCSKHTVKMQRVVQKCLNGYVGLKRVEPPLKASPARDDRQHRERRKLLLKLKQSFAITVYWPTGDSGWQWDFRGFMQSNFNRRFALVTCVREVCAAFANKWPTWETSDNRPWILCAFIWRRAVS